MIRQLGGILGLLFLFSCNVSPQLAGRSGPIDDDYVEEHLSSRVKDYKIELETSNQILDEIMNDSLDSCYETYFSELLKGMVSLEEYKSIIGRVNEGAGPLKAYKKYQWHFFEGREKGLDLLFSVKIAEHESKMVNYLFVFEKGGEKNKLVGFFVKERAGVLAPGKY
ncbi:MAG: hypothetical protein H6510_00360 [Acidobacteria bacterium]|nr:hypothetical protein [Acidobacteriota bacterium]